MLHACLRHRPRSSSDLLAEMLITFMLLPMLGIPAPPLLQRVHSLQGQPSSKSGHVRSVAESEVNSEHLRLCGKLTQLDGNAVGQHGAWANIPPERNRKDPICFSPYV
jgi:hypothetical protein